MAYLTPRTLAALLILAPTSLLAQSAPATPANSNPPPPAVVPTEKVKAKTLEEENKALELEEFEVTGSRIRTLGGEATAIPVFSLPQIELERRGVTRLADIRWAIPQLAGSVGFNDNLMNGGTSRAQQVGTSFNLRGLGGNSTLVLVDGRRVPHTGQEAPGGAGGREDFSVDGIPVSAIERIDVLPQGAGAVYGSEAIAGVINIILKKNYTGAELSVTYDNTFDSDVGQFTASLTGGYRAGKLSTFFTVSMEEQNALAAKDRWFSETFDSRRYGATNSFFLSNVPGGPGSFASSFSPQNPGQPNLPGLTTNVVGIPVGSNGTTAANTAFTTSVAAPFDGAPYSTSIDEASRRSAVVKADYELARWATLFVEGRYSEFENDFSGGPLTLSTTLPAGYPGNPFSGSAVLRKVFYDLPVPRTISKQENMGAVVGLRGEFFADWRYDASASWARNIVSDDAIVGGLNFSLLNAAINSANRPLLAYDSSTISNPNAPGVIEALRPVSDHKDTTDVYQYLVTAEGPVWEGWAGYIRAAVGLEAGEEKVKFFREPGPASFAFVLSKPFSRELTAAFSEVSIPLLSEKQDLPLVHRLEVGGAIRATDYSDSGSVTTPTYRALFQPTKWLTLRASRSEGFKPVRLYDLQAPVSNFLSNVTLAQNVRDPLRGGEQVVGTNFPNVSGGNPALKPEESVSRGFGVVLDVPGAYFKGLSFSADYYELEYTERSGSTSLQNLLNFFPERIVRGPRSAADIAAGFAGPVVGWDGSNINLAGVTTKGWDYRVSYQRRFDNGDLSVTGSWSDPDVTFTKATPAATPSSTFGHQPRRASGSVFWSTGPWDAGVSVNYQTRYFINGLTGAAYPSYWETNPQVSYNFERSGRFEKNADSLWRRTLSGSKLTLTVINAFDNDPDMVDVANGRVVMDPRLRRYIISFSKKL